MMKRCHHTSRPSRERSSEKERANSLKKNLHSIVNVSSNNYRRKSQIFNKSSYAKSRREGENCFSRERRCSQDHTNKYEKEKEKGTLKSLFNNDNRFQEEGGFYTFETKKIPERSLLSNFISERVLNIDAYFPDNNLSLAKRKCAEQRELSMIRSEKNIFCRTDCKRRSAPDISLTGNTKKLQASLHQERRKSDVEHRELSPLYNSTPMKYTDLPENGTELCKNNEVNESTILEPRRMSLLKKMVSDRFLWNGPDNNGTNSDKRIVCKTNINRRSFPEISLAGSAGELHATLYQERRKSDVEHREQSPLCNSTPEQHIGEPENGMELCKNNEIKNPILKPRRMSLLKKMVTDRFLWNGPDNNGTNLDKRNVCKTSTNRRSFPEMSLVGSVEKLHLHQERRKSEGEPTKLSFLHNFILEGCSKELGNGKEPCKNNEGKNPITEPRRMSLLKKMVTDRFLWNGSDNNGTNSDKRIVCKTNTNRRSFPEISLAGSAGELHASLYQERRKSDAEPTKLSFLHNFITEGYTKALENEIEPCKTKVENPITEPRRVSMLKNMSNRFLWSGPDNNGTHSDKKNICKAVSENDETNSCKAKGPN